MERHSILIVGASLFAETLVYTLASSGVGEPISAVPTPEAALAQIKTRCPDVVILAGVSMPSPLALGQFLEAAPDLLIVRADLAEDSVQVISSRQLGVHTTDLLAALRTMPERLSS